MLMALSEGEGVISTIDYGKAVDLKEFHSAVTKLTLDVKNASGEKIGTLSAPYFASAVLVYKGGQAFIVLDRWLLLLLAMHSLAGCL